MIAVCNAVRLPTVSVYEDSEVVLTSEYHLLMLQLDARDVAIGFNNFSRQLDRMTDVYDASFQNESHSDLTVISTSIANGLSFTKARVADLRLDFDGVMRLYLNSRSLSSTDQLFSMDDNTGWTHIYSKYDVNGLTTMELPVFQEVISCVQDSLDDLGYNLGLNVFSLVSLHSPELLDWQVLSQIVFHTFDTVSSSLRVCHEKLTDLQSDLARCQDGYITPGLLPPVLYSKFLRDIRSSLHGNRMVHAIRDLYNYYDLEIRLVTLKEFLYVALYVPIYNPSDKYQIYYISQEPVVTEKSVISFDLESRYVLYSKGNGNYVLLDDISSVCKNRVCLSDPVKYEMSEYHHCVASVLSNNVNTTALSCHLLVKPLVQDKCEVNHVFGDTYLLMFCNNVTDFTLTCQDDIVSKVEIQSPVKLFDVPPNCVLRSSLVSVN